jgi:hypothetical protein
LCSNGIRCFFRPVMAYHNYHDNDYPYYGTEDCWEYSWVLEEWWWDYDSSSSPRPNVD